MPVEAAATETNATAGTAADGAAVVVWALTGARLRLAGAGEVRTAGPVDLDD